MRSNDCVFRTPERLLHPRKALQLRFSLHKNRAQIALLGERINRDLHEVFFVFGEIGEKARRSNCGHFGKDFVRLIHDGKGRGD